MKLIKLKEDHYIIVDDLEIKEGNWYENNGVIFRADDKFDEGNNPNQNKKNKKITHSTVPLGFLNEAGFTTANLKPDWVNALPLTLQEVKELLGEVDVEKKAKESNDNHIKEFKSYPEIRYLHYGKGFISGYNQALEDNKEKRYTLEDLEKAIEIAQTTSYVSTQLFSGHSSVKHNFKPEEIIQSLKPKTEWEVEFIDGKLKLKS